MIQNTIKGVSPQSVDHQKITNQPEADASQVEQVNNSSSYNLRRLFKEQTFGGIPEAYNAIRIYSIGEIKQIGLQWEELVAMIDSLNGCLTDPIYQCITEVLLSRLQEFEELEGGLTRNKVVPENLYLKLAKLTSAQTYFLQEEIYQWWNQDYGNVMPITLDEFISKFQK